MSKTFFIILMSLFLVASCTCNNKRKPQVNETRNVTDTTVTIPSDNNASGGRTFSETDSMAVANNMANMTAHKKAYTHPMYSGSTPGEFPEGSERILSDTDVKYLSQWGLKVMLNEIYARHGQTFPNDPELEAHFRRAGWYRGENPHAGKNLTRVERQNIAFLNRYHYKAGVE